MVRVTGTDKTGEVMGHTPNSRTMERFYVNMAGYLGVHAIGVGESQKIAEIELDQSRPALGKLEEARIAEMYGEPLNALATPYRLELIVKDETPFGGNTG